MGFVSVGSALCFVFLITTKNIHVIHASFTAHRDSN